MIHELIDLSDNLSSELVSIPPDADDVCPVCRTGKLANSVWCMSCTKTAAQVDHPCLQVIPISFYTTPSRLRDRMHDFKEHPDADVRAEEGRAVASLLARYMHEHSEAMSHTFGHWEATVAVPSSRHDRLPALQLAIQDNFADYLSPFERPLRRGTDDMDFNQAKPAGFVLNDTGTAIRGRSYLLIDDTFTTGARLQSAHHALIAAGATVPAAVVVTRKINPSIEYGSQDMWDRQVAAGFDFGSNPWWRT